MASTPKSFPHYRVNVVDNSIVDVAINEVLPVHRPCYVMRAERGPINQLKWCPTFNDAAETFGKSTFKTNSKYFSMPALFLLNTMTNNGAFIMRVADDTADTAKVILEAHIKTNVSIPKYLTDENGQRFMARNPDTGALEYAFETQTVQKTVQGPLVDSYGSPIIDPATGEQQIGDIVQDVEEPVMVQGVEISWHVRTSLNEGETGLDDLKASPTDGIYPILAFEALSPGAFGNNLAFSLFYDKGQNSEGVMNEYRSLFYSFEALERLEGDSSYTPIRSSFGSVLNFAGNADAVNKDTGFNYNMDGVLTRAFAKSKAKLPYDIYTYEENLQAIGNIAAEFALNAATFTDGSLGFIDADNYEDFAGVHMDQLGNFTVDADSELGYMINVVSGVNLKGFTYDMIRVTYDSDDVDAVALRNKFNIKLKDGSDGDITDTMVNERLKKFFRGNLPEDGSVVDKFRYPMTHIFDTGFPVDVKLEMIDFLSIRDDIGIVISTQVATIGQAQWNTREADETNGQFLRSRALLQRESTTKNTDCCRAAIYPQAGILADGAYTGVVPFTFWAAMKCSQYGNLPYMSSQEPRGLNHAVNEYFREYNWLNFDEEGQSRVWDMGMNYCQAGDMRRIFYPAERTVYRADTSVLIDKWFVDAVIYTKHVIRKAWAIHVGRNDPATILNESIISYLKEELAYLYNGKYTFDVSIVQSEEEQALGYVRHAYVRIMSPTTMRVLEVDIEVNREADVTEEQ